MTESKGLPVITVIPAIQIVMYIVERLYNGLWVGRRLG